MRLKRSNPNWYADGEPGTREQWRERAFEQEDKASASLARTYALQAQVANLKRQAEQLERPKNADEQWKARQDAIAASLGFYRETQQHQPDQK